MSELKERKLGFLGAGNMASALIGGLVRSYLVEPASIIASDVDPERRGRIAREFGIRMTGENREVVRFADVVVLAVKPKVVPKVLEEVGSLVRADQLFISICAGVSAAFLESHLPNHPPVIRAMPNTPAQVGEGISAIACGAHACSLHCDVAKAILGAVGEVIELEEKHMDAVTAISGSGPAYFFYLMEQMEAAGLAEGLPPGVTQKLIKQTALGAAKLALESSDNPRELRQDVTSPGGTTDAAISFLESKGVGQLIVHAVREAAKRSRELGK
jgi:pyrroline-5-carboxylate reductase